MVELLYGLRRDARLRWKLIRSRRWWKVLVWALGTIATYSLRAVADAASTSWARSSSDSVETFDVRAGRRTDGHRLTAMHEFSPARLAVATDLPPDSGWAFEPTFDGYRCLAERALCRCRSDGHVPGGHGGNGR